MKRVLLLTLEFPPDRGGVARYYGGLVHAMPEGSVVVMRASLSRWIWPAWLPLLWKVWWKIRYEHITEVWVGHILPLGTVIYLFKKLLVTGYSLPVTVFTHGMDVLIPQCSWRKKRLLERILRAADRVVTISNFTKNELLKLGVAEEKIVIVLPCPDRRLQIIDYRLQNLKERYHLGGKKILLTVARLVKRKGIDLVIEALRKVQIPDLVYVVVGDGPEKGELQLLVTGYSLPVTFIGVVSDAELSAWYDACDVFIMTPRQIGGDVEGFGLVYLEANSHGKPVIGSRSGGVPDAVLDGETGLLVDEGDVHGIVQAIERLFSDEALRKKFGDKGRERVEREFQYSPLSPLD